MGMNSSPTQVEPGPYENQLAKMSKQLFSETTPLRQSLTDQMGQIVGGNYRPSDLPTYQPLYAQAKSGIEDQYNVAKGNLLGGIPRGGAMASSLGSLEADRAKTMGSVPSQITTGLIGDITNKAYGTAFAAPGQAMTGLSSASGTYGNRQSQQMAIDAQQRAAQNEMIGKMGGSIGSFMLK